MRYIVLVVSLFVSVLVWSQELPFVFKGKVENTDLGKNEAGVTVSVIQNGSTLFSTSSASSGKYSLRGNVNYTIPFEVVFSKAGLVSKKVSFDLTKMNEEDAPPGDMKPVEELNMELFKERENVDFSFLQTQAVASFDWNTRGLSVRLDAVESNKIRTKILELLANADKDKAEAEQKYQAAIQAADAFYNEQKYEEALEKYEEALGYKPKEKYPADRIVELDALIQAQKKEELAQQQEDSEYNNLIAAGDNLRDQDNLQGAISKYQEAITKKDEQYPKDQIEALTKLINDRKKEAENEEKYQAAIKSADAFLKQKSLKAARDKYIEATKLKPSEQYPKDKLAELDGKLEAEKEKEAIKKKYDDAILAGDQLFDSENFEGAKEKYEEALTFEASSSYAKGRITMCDDKLAAAKAEKERLEKIQALLTQGNEEMSKSEWEAAKSSFTEVLGLETDHPEATEKLAIVEQKIKEAGDLALQEEKYNKLIQEGDSENGAGNLDNALAKYEEASSVKSTEEVAKKIADVKALIAERDALADKEAKYDAYMSEGESMMGIIGDLDGAREQFENALALFGDRELPKQKIAEIDGLLASQNEAKAKKEAYDAAILSADGLFDGGKLEEAKGKYNEAKSIDESQSYPTERITEIEKLLAEQAAENDKKASYEAAILSADGLFDAGKLEEAKEKYNVAKSIDDSQSYPTERITEIENLLAEQAAENDKKASYEAAINSANTLFNQAKWEEAKAKYREAMTFDDTQSYPGERIAEIDAKLADQEADAAKRAGYEAAINSGDNLFNQAKWEEAKEKYREALTFDDSKSYASDRITEIDKLIAEKEAEEALSEQVSKLLADGTQLYDQKKLDDAKSKFEEVLTVDPGNAEASSMLNTINTELSAMKNEAEKDELFNSLKQEGYDLADNQSYDLAKQKLLEALTLKEDGDVRKKIEEIESAMAELAKQSGLEAEYANLISEAQSREGASNYPGAIAKYREALGVKPEEQMPKDKIAELEGLMSNAAKQAEEDKEYKAFMEKGDDLVSQNKYLEAIKEYNNALAVKPSEKEPVDKAAEAERLAKANSDVDEQYEKILTVAQKKIDGEEYDRAIELLERAIGLKERDDRPKEMLAKTKELKKNKAAYEALMSQGHSLASSNNYEDAKAKYQEALGKKPGETEPVEKIAEMDRLINEQSSAAQKEALYAEFMSKGNSSQNGKNYEQALSQFQNALSVKKGDVPAQNKINEIQQILDDLANSSADDLKRKNEFDALIKAADGEFALESYLPAKRNYEEALKIDPSSSYARTQVKECVRLERLISIQEAEREYRKIVDAADKNFNNETYEKAKSYYERALTIKREDPYPKKKLAEIEAILNPVTVASVELEDLGDPFDNSIMDGMAALSEAEERRKGLNNARIDKKLDNIKDSESEMTMRKTQDHYDNSNKIYMVHQQITIDAGESDLNREEIVAAIRVAERELAETQRNNSNFEHSENLNDQGVLYAIDEEVALDYGERHAVYAENADIMKSYNTAMAKELTEDAYADYGRNVDSDQKLMDVKIKVDQGVVEDYAERAKVREDVVKAHKYAVDEASEMSADRYEVQLDNMAVVADVNAAVSSKTLEDTEMAKDNNEELINVRNTIIDGTYAQNQVEQSTVYKANAEMADVKVRVQSDQEDLGRNRTENVEILKVGKKELADAEMAKYNSEMDKYVQNKEGIAAQVVVNGEVSELEKAAHAKKVAYVDRMDKKAFVETQAGQEGDTEERLNTKKSIESVYYSTEANTNEEVKKIAENATNLADISKTIKAQDAAKNIGETEKHYGVKDAIDNVDDSPRKKVKVANALGEEYPEGVSEESFTKSDQNGLMTTIITRRIVVIDGHADVYIRTQTLNGITYSRNGKPSLSHVWSKETQDPSLERHY
jgi:tetratricopeptide (TPR) repeat protein